MKLNSHQLAQRCRTCSSAHGESITCTYTATKEERQVLLLEASRRAKDLRSQGATGHDLINDLDVHGADDLLETRLTIGAVLAQEPRQRYYRFCSQDPHGRYRPLVPVPGDHDHGSAAALVGKGFDQQGPVLDTTPLNDWEVQDLLQQCALSNKQINAIYGTDANWRTLLEKLPRVTVPCLGDFDSDRDRPEDHAYARTWIYRYANAWKALHTGMEVTVTMSSGGCKVGYHVLAGPADEEARDPRLLSKIGTLATKVAADCGMVPWEPANKRSAKSVHLGNNASTWVPPEHQNDDNPPLKLDLVPLAHAPNGRERIIRAIGAAYKIFPYKCTLDPKWPGRANFLPKELLELVPEPLPAKALSNEAKKRIRRKEERAREEPKPASKRLWDEAVASLRQVGSTGRRHSIRYAFAGFWQRFGLGDRRTFGQLVRAGLSSAEDYDDAIAAWDSTASRRAARQPISSTGALRKQFSPMELHSFLVANRQILDTDFIDIERLFGTQTINTAMAYHIDNADSTVPLVPLDDEDLQHKRRKLHRRLTASAACRVFKKTERCSHCDKRTCKCKIMHCDIKELCQVCMHRHLSSLNDWMKANWAPSQKWFYQRENHPTRQSAAQRDIHIFPIKKVIAPLPDGTWDVVMFTTDIEARDCLLGGVGTPVLKSNDFRNYILEFMRLRHVTPMQLASEGKHGAALELCFDMYGTNAAYGSRAISWPTTESVQALRKEMYAEEVDPNDPDLCHTCPQDTPVRYDVTHIPTDTLIVKGRREIPSLSEVLTAYKTKRITGDEELPPLMHDPSLDPCFQLE